MSDHEEVHHTIDTDADTSLLIDQGQESPPLEAEGQEAAAEDLPSAATIITDEEEHHPNAVIDTDVSAQLNVDNQESNIDLFIDAQGSPSLSHRLPSPKSPEYIDDPDAVVVEHHQHSEAHAGEDEEYAHHGGNGDTLAVDERRDSTPGADVDAESSDHNQTTSNDTQQNNDVSQQQDEMDTTTNVQQDLTNFSNDGAGGEGSESQSASTVTTAQASNNDTHKDSSSKSAEKSGESRKKSDNRDDRCYEWDSKGSCRWGDSCRFNHDNVSNKREICADFSRGRCHRANCKFSHDDAGKSSSSGSKDRDRSRDKDHDRDRDRRDSSRSSSKRRHDDDDDSRSTEKRPMRLHCQIILITAHPQASKIAGDVKRELSEKNLGVIVSTMDPRLILPTIGDLVRDNVPYTAIITTECAQNGSLDLRIIKTVPPREYNAMFWRDAVALMIADPASSSRAPRLIASSSSSRGQDAKRVSRDQRDDVARAPVYDARPAAYAAPQYAPPPRQYEQEAPSSRYYDPAPQPSSRFYEQPPPLASSHNYDPAPSRRYDAPLVPRQYEAPVVPPRQYEPARAYEAPVSRYEPPVSGAAGSSSGGRYDPYYEQPPAAAPTQPPAHLDQLASKIRHILEKREAPAAAAPQQSRPVDTPYDSRQRAGDSYPPNSYADSHPRDPYAPPSTRAPPPRTDYYDAPIAYAPASQSRPDPRADTRGLPRPDPRGDTRVSTRAASYGAEEPQYRSQQPASYDPRAANPRAFDPRSQSRPEAAPSQRAYKPY